MPGRPSCWPARRIAASEQLPAEAFREFEESLKETAKARPEVRDIPLRLVI